MAVFLLLIFSLRNLLSPVNRSHWQTFAALGPNDLPLVAPFLSFKLALVSFTGLTVRGRGKGEDDETGNVTGPRGRYYRGLCGGDGCVVVGIGVGVVVVVVVVVVVFVALSPPRMCVCVCVTRCARGVAWSWSCVRTLCFVKESFPYKMLGRRRESVWPSPRRLHAGVLAADWPHIVRWGALARRSEGRVFASRSHQSGSRRVWEWGSGCCYCRQCTLYVQGVSQTARVAWIYNDDVKLKDQRSHSKSGRFS